MASPVKYPNNLQINNTDSCEDNEVPTQRLRRGVKKFFDTDSDSDQPRLKINGDQTDSENENVTPVYIQHKSRTRITLQNDTDSDSEGLEFKKNTEQQIRMKNKSNKIKEKFKGLLESRKHEQEPKNIPDDIDVNSNSEVFSENMSSVEKIKEIINERTTIISSLCDPDTSDEEDSELKRILPQKKERKSVKATSPKPMRMSAKQAMDNMHKIKSESNRMLREKEVSLPYHRPKALTLKDVMSRRKLALNADGKALPIKMNEVQLKEYVLLLEQRQKEMIELCKSESDEEIDKDRSSLDIDKPNNDNLESFDAKMSNPEIVNCINHQTSEKDQPTSNEEIPSLLEKTEIDIQDSASNPEDNNNELSNIDLAESNNSNSHVDSLNDNHTMDNLESMNDGAEETHTSQVIGTSTIKESSKQTKAKPESESQLIHLHYNSETLEDTVTDLDKMNKPPIFTQDSCENKDNYKELEENGINDFTFSDDELNLDNIDNLIENAEIIKETQDEIDSTHLIKDPKSFNTRPKLSGAPGTIIDLDETDPITTRKLTGVELLKERFSYFARIKTPDELEREKEQKRKPGSLHLRLKQNLEDQIAEQRSLEWAKRLEHEKQQQIEMQALRGEESDVEDDIEKIEAKLKEKEDYEEIIGESGSSDENIIEDDVVLKDKPRNKNAMIDYEAEESDCDENDMHKDDIVENDDNQDSEENNINESSENDSNDESDVDDESDDESSDNEKTITCRKGRILKAFEDSDDEEKNYKEDEKCLIINAGDKEGNANLVGSQIYMQDDEIELAQISKSQDIFTGIESGKAVLNNSHESDTKDDSFNKDKQLGVFSIASKNLDGSTRILSSSDKISEITDTQTFDNDSLIPICEAPLSTLTQSILPSQIPTRQSQSQPIGEDILALCTGNFYDNEFMSQPVHTYTPSPEITDCDSQKLSTVKLDDLEESNISFNINTPSNIDINEDIPKKVNEDVQSTNNSETYSKVKQRQNDNELSEEERHNVIDNDKPNTEDSNILKSILDELHDPEFDSPKPNKFFIGNTKVDNLIKKKFVIESDDDDTKEENASSEKKKKRLKKRKPTTRALQISDDEEDIEDQEEEYDSDLEDDSERIVEYDSEENEVIVNIEQPKKKKRKVGDFFEQEAELTSEDEWVGSGDEDEAGLDRMEREEGDDDQFNQKQLQRELEQIHMRDVLDQDKREVRIIQELLFEDGDLGAGSRQRKFRWKNADGEEETGTINDDFTETQEEEFESEEQWRKQRHEREVFLRQMKNEHETNLDVSLNRTSIIKANLSMKSLNNVLAINTNSIETTDKAVPIEKKSSKDIPSPKKPFAIFKQNYHGSLLTRGRGALARLAALATPLAVDDDGPKVGSLAPSSKRNFVFAALSQDSKVTKRKGDNVEATPVLVKKMKLDAKQKYLKSSLLDHLKI